MADSEMEEWARRSRAIEAEREKAARSIEQSKSTQINSAFLDVKSTNLKGYSRDAESLVRGAEKIAGLGLGFAVLGIVVRWIARIIPDLSGVVTKILSIAGTVMLGIAIISAVVALGYCLYYRGKVKFDFKNVVVTAVAGLVVALIYIVFNFALMVAEFGM